MHPSLVTFFSDFASNIVFTALASGFTYLYFKFGWRRLFGVSDPSDVVVVVAASMKKREKFYEHVATGLGQVQSLANLAPRFAQAYWGKRLDRVYTSEDELRERVQCDLLVLGGEMNNSLTRELLEAWAEEKNFPVQTTGRLEINWQNKSYESTGDGTRLTTDYGLIVRAPNPLTDDPKRVALLISGASSVGGHAASKVYTRDRLFRRKKYVAALVKCRVKDGFPVQTQLLHLMTRSKSTQEWTTVQKRPVK